MTGTTDITTDAQHDGTDADSASTLTRRSLLSGASAALLATGAASGTASADATGQVGTGERPVERVVTAAIDGGVTGTTIKELTGDALAVDGGALSAADARLTVTDGDTTVENVVAISFEGSFSVAESGEGVTIDR